MLAIPTFAETGHQGSTNTLRRILSSTYYLASRIHGVGQFLAWHSTLPTNDFTKIHYELSGYNGTQPLKYGYWDWTLDADGSESLLESPVFDPVTGFGGTGGTGTYALSGDPDGTNKFFVPRSFVGCVKDGPFASYVVRLGPGKLITNHCLVRGVNDTFKQYFTSSAVENAMRLPTFELFRVELEGGPVTQKFEMHDGGHASVGGEMTNFYSGLADPLSYLHHANLDRVWWNWQQMHPSSRLYAVSGRSTVTPPYQNITLDFGLDMDGFAPITPICQVMDIHSQSMCYTYV